MINIIRVFAILLLFSLPVSKSFSQDNTENIDEIVKNPELVKAIDDLARNSTRETKLRLMTELNEANYLVPVVSDDIDGSKADEKGVIRLSKDNDIMVLSMTDGNGKQFMPVFTDMKSADKWSTDKDFKTIAMPADKVWSFALSKDYYEGVVVNPGVKAVPLSKEMVKVLQNRK